MQQRPAALKRIQQIDKGQSTGSALRVMLIRIYGDPLKVSQFNQGQVYSSTDLAFLWASLVTRYDRPQSGQAVWQRVSHR